jgi:hypothetical protein
LGRGFRVIGAEEDWCRFVESCPVFSDFVIQPFLVGAETRLTLCRDGTFAAGRLLEREASRSRWADTTDEVPHEWLVDLAAVLMQLQTPVIGVDVMQVEGIAHVLDVNVAPDIAIHLVTRTPRNLAGAVLDSWMLMR